MHLWGTPLRVGVLHASAVGMRRVDGASGHQPERCWRPKRPARHAAARRGSANRRAGRPAQGVDREGGGDVGGARQPPRVDKGQRQDRRGRLRPVDECEPFFGPSATGCKPARAQRLGARDAAEGRQRFAFADQDERKMRQRREVSAGADRAAARHDGMHVRVEQREQRVDCRGRMPEWPRASTLARSSIIARTASAARGSPTPAAWLRSRLACSRSSASGSMRTSANDPKPVLMP